MDLVEEIYRLVRGLPQEELYALSDQMRRACISIPSNIAEGQQRGATRDFIRFLSIARGSTAELRTQLLICERLNYLQRVQIQNALNSCDEIGKMLTALIDSLSEKL